MLSVNCGFHESQQGQKLLIYWGPGIRVNIGFDHTYRPESNAPPKAQKTNVQALIDSGARESCIDSALAAELGLIAKHRTHQIDPLRPIWLK